ncbi:MAG: response regulator [Candidatus Saccharibacteria bacterium]|nr:response regulator [Candidatus Saccharibacteria bacterium]
MTKVKILLVEDDKSLREIYGVRLLAEGYDIVSAGDGEEALAMAIKERPQLIISDVMMPKISGFDMLDILRSTTETRGIKVIIMTALSSQDQRMRGEALGADRYLVKSQVGIEDVVRAVHDVLGDTGVSHRPAAHTTPEPQPSAPANLVPPASQPQPTTLPQPTAPFSTPRPASLGERVIHPLQSSMPRPDYASLIDDELDAASGASQPTAPQPPAEPTTPQPFTLPPAEEAPEAEIVTHHDEHQAAPTNNASSPAEAPHLHIPLASDAPTTQPLINDIIAPHSTAPSGIPDVHHHIVTSQPAHYTHTPADDEAELAEALRTSTQQTDDETDTDAAAYQPSQNQLVTDAVASLNEQMDTIPNPVEPLAPATTAAYDTPAPSHTAPVVAAQPPATYHEHHEDSPAHPATDSAAIAPHSTQAIAADPSDALAAALLQGSAAAHPSVSPVNHPLYDAIRPAPVAAAHSAPAQPVDSAAGQPSTTHHAASAPQPGAAPSHPAPTIQHSHDNISFEETERAAPSAGSH